MGDRLDAPSTEGPYQNHRIGRPRLSTSTVLSAPPVVVVRCTTRQASRSGPPSLVRDSAIAVCVPSGRISSPRRPKPSCLHSVTSPFGWTCLTVTSPETGFG